MNNKQIFTLTALALVALSIYLFVSAPSPLPEEGITTGEKIPIEVVLELVAKENDIARALYTSEIVGAGGRAGLAFDERWRDDNVEAGPLPALFLREASGSLEKNPVPLSLFLGSDFPIEASNRFQGVQEEQFNNIRITSEPQFFYAEDTERYTAMFPDYASVQPCVTCHNEHPNSPKTDWVLDDIMGATTWTYPKEEVTLTEALAIIGATRKGFADAYTSYLEKAENFSAPPEIGEGWPRDGYYLPSLDIFLAEFSSRASSHSIDTLIEAAGMTEATSTSP